ELAREREAAHRCVAVRGEPRQRVSNFGGLERLELLVREQLAQRKRIRIEEASQVGGLARRSTVAQIVVALEHSRQTFDGSTRLNRRRSARPTQLVINATELLRPLFQFCAGWPMLPAAL